MTFIDTNVLVYAVDGRDSEKQQAAKRIVMAAKNSSRYMISAQVLNEFSNVALNKLKKTMDHHLDHVMTYAATMKAVALAKITPEIYYHEQDRQTKGFQPMFWVDISAVEAEKERIIGFYECQGGAKHIAPNKRTAADFRGRNMHRRAAFAEAYAVYPGAAQGSGCIFSELPKR